MKLTPNQLQVLNLIANRHDTDRMMRPRGYALTIKALLRRSLIERNPRSGIDKNPWVATPEGLRAIAIRKDRPPLVVVTIPNDGTRSEPKWARTWWKKVDSINTDLLEKKGYCLRGKFLGSGQHRIEANTILIKVEIVGEDYDQRHMKDGTIYRVLGDGTLKEEGFRRWDTHFLTFIDDLAKALGQKRLKFEHCTDEEMIEELELRGYHVKPTPELLEERKKKTA